MSNAPVKLPANQIRAHACAILKSPVSFNEPLRCWSNDESVRPVVCGGLCEAASDHRHLILRGARESRGRPWYQARRSREGTGPALDTRNWCPQCPVESSSYRVLSNYRVPQSLFISDLAPELELYVGPYLRVRHSADE